MFDLVVARPETEVNNDARFVQKQNRRRSRSCAVMIVEHSTKTLAPMHRLRWCDDRGGPQELVLSDKRARTFKRSAVLPEGLARARSRRTSSRTPG
jgi:hypothetical protein